MFEDELTKMRTRIEELYKEVSRKASASGPGSKEVQALTSTFDQRFAELEEKLEEKCSICMSEMEEGEVVSTLKCSHKYHKECVEEYLSQHSNKCPICRANVSDEPDYKY